MPDLRLYDVYESQERFASIYAPQERFASIYARRIYKQCCEQGKWHFREFLKEILGEFHAELWEDNTTVVARFHSEADLVHFQMVWG